MLQKKTVESSTLELLNRIMKSKHIEHFALAGGTGLSLLLGHRRSIDLDFFTNEPFDSNELYNNLGLEGFVFDKDTIDIKNNTINGHIENIQVQFLGHLYKRVVPLILEEGIRIYDLPDIAAMKLNAISNRGAKKAIYAQRYKNVKLQNILFT